MGTSGEMPYSVNELVIALAAIGLLLTIEARYRMGDGLAHRLTDSAKSPVRVAAMENHVPETVLLLLFLVAVVVMLIGRGCGLAKRRHFLPSFVLALLIGMVVIVIVDLDRLSRGLICVSQESMIWLRDSLKHDAL